MIMFKRFEEIKAWQMARAMNKKIYLVSNGTNFSKDFALRNQMRESAVSIMANIAEGFERYSKKEFVQFLVIAKGLAGELRSHLYIAFDLGYIEDDNCEELIKRCESISGCIYKLIEHLKKK